MILDCVLLSRTCRLAWEKEWEKRRMERKKGRRCFSFLTVLFKAVQNWQYSQIQYLWWFLSHVWEWNLWIVTRKSKQKPLKDSQCSALLGKAYLHHLYFYVCLLCMKFIIINRDQETPMSQEQFTLRWILGHCACFMWVLIMTHKRVWYARQPFRPTLNIIPSCRSYDFAWIIYTFIVREYFLKSNGKNVHFFRNEVFKEKTSLFCFPIYVLRYHSVAGLEGISGYCSTAVMQPLLTGHLTDCAARTGPACLLESSGVTLHGGRLAWHIRGAQEIAVGHTEWYRAPLYRHFQARGSSREVSPGTFQHWFCLDTIGP